MFEECGTRIDPETLEHVSSHPMDVDDTTGSGELHFFQLWLTTSALNEAYAGAQTCPELAEARLVTIEELSTLETFEAAGRFLQTLATKNG